MDDIHSIQLHESYDIYHQRRVPYIGIDFSTRLRPIVPNFMSAIFTYIIGTYRSFNSLTTRCTYLKKGGDEYDEDG